MVKSRNFQLLKQRFFLPVSEHRIEIQRAGVWSPASNAPVCNFWLTPARKLILTAFFICSCGKDTGTRTKSFHRKVSYKKDSTLKPRFFQKFRKIRKKIHKNFKKIFLSPWKTLSSRLSIKKSKKNFLVKSALSFLPTTTNWLIVRFY